MERYYAPLAVGLYSSQIGSFGKMVLSNIWGWKGGDGWEQGRGGWGESFTDGSARHPLPPSSIPLPTLLHIRTSWPRWVQCEIMSGRCFVLRQRQWWREDRVFNLHSPLDPDRRRDKAFLVNLSARTESTAIQINIKRCWNLWSFCSSRSSSATLWWWPPTAPTGTPDPLDTHMENKTTPPPTIVGPDNGPLEPWGILSQIMKKSL